MIRSPGWYCAGKQILFVYITYIDTWGSGAEQLLVRLNFLYIFRLTLRLKDVELYYRPHSKEQKVGKLMINTYCCFSS